MAANEDMAASFYKIGNAADLAEQLIAILQSPELQIRMAECNFAAGARMTMASVVRNYLRWFELNQCKRELQNSRFLPWPRRVWPFPLSSRSQVAPPAWPLPLNSSLQAGDGFDGRLGLESVTEDSKSIPFVNARAWGPSKTSKVHPGNEEYE
jgi:hypothetical protein